MDTMNVKPWGKGQGDFVVINKADFDPAVHDASNEMILDGAKKASDGLKLDEIRAALAAKNIDIPEGAKKADLQKLLDEAPAA